MKKICLAERGDREDLKTAILSLSIACPYSLDPKPTDCPICHIRTFPTHEILNWLKDISDEDLYQYYSKHQNCLSQQEMK